MLIFLGAVYRDWGAAVHSAYSGARSSDVLVGCESSVALENDHVAILMCTYNGGAFLRAQLDSISSQSHGDWSLHVSDDGSTDGTHELLRSFQHLQGAHRVHLYAGPGIGFVANFLSLTCREGIHAQFFAWSDQDDVWHEDKLQVALKWLRRVPAERPALYCGRTQIVCEAGAHRTFSPRFTFAPHFRNALVQSIAGGNTMVFNLSARALLVEAGWHVAVPSHDWWCYQLVCGAEGEVRYDPRPWLMYRQHAGNIIGSNTGLNNQLKRCRMLLEGKLRGWNTQNICALEKMQHRFDEKHRRSLALFKAARQQRLPWRLLNLLRARLYRQTLMGNIGLFAAALLKKI
ncbi:glycosyltransferase family 2 protein [Pseudomonas farsensis]|uniref:Glycosyltransferase family 2 protein n=1 Tax=Pseudomonas farsensis TaxID=2745492 RepID=A0ABU8QV51_9PSED